MLHRYPVRTRGDRVECKPARGICRRALRPQRYEGCRYRVEGKAVEGDAHDSDGLTLKRLSQQESRDEKTVHLPRLISEVCGGQRISNRERVATTTARGRGARLDATDANRADPHTARSDRKGNAAAPHRPSP